jgi:esterase/lipase
MTFEPMLNIEIPAPQHESFFLPGTNPICIVLIPGWSETPSYMMPMAYYLNSFGYSIYVAKHPTYTTGMRWQDWWHAVWLGIVQLKKRGVHQLYLVGHSMGGLFALLATTLHKHLFSNGVKVVGTVAICPPFYIRKDLRLLTEAVRVTTLDRRAAKALDQLHATIHFDPDETYFSRYRGSKPNRPIGSIFELIHAIRFSRYQLKKTTFDVPALVIFANDDTIVDNNYSSRFAKRLGTQVYHLNGRHSVILDTSCRQICQEIHFFIHKNRQNNG